MAKGQLRSTKEKRKPKADKNKKGCRAGRLAICGRPGTGEAGLQSLRQEGLGGAHSSGSVTSCRVTLSWFVTGAASLLPDA